MDRASHPFLLATECTSSIPPFSSVPILITGLILFHTLWVTAADRVQHPTDPSRLIKGVDVLPWVLSPLMGPEEIDIEVSLKLTSLFGIWEEALIDDGDGGG